MKMIRLIELRHEITRSGKPEIIAFVEGGFTGIPATARGNEPALVNDIGERYFMQMKGLLCLGLESAIEMYVLDPLSHQNGGDDDLTRHIKHNVTKNNKAPEYKKALEQNLGTSVLKEELNKIEARTRKIDEALRALNQHFKVNYHYPSRL